MVLYETRGNGDCMFAALYAVATVKGHPLGGRLRTVLDVLQGKRLEETLEKEAAGSVRNAIVDFLKANKHKEIPKGVVSGRKGRVANLLTWEQFFDRVLGGEDGKETYDQHCERMGNPGEWGSILELRAAETLGIPTKVVKGDRQSLMFREPREPEETVNEEPLIWHHKDSPTDETENHYDVLTTHKAKRILLRKRTVPNMSDEEWNRIARQPSPESVDWEHVELESGEESLESGEESDSSVDIEG